MKNKKICILGLGYIGLPTAAMFATHGYQIVGVDVNSKITEALKKGTTVIKEPYLDLIVQAAVTSGNLVARSKPEKADVYIICVPTPINEDKKADMSCVIEATKSIVPFIEKGSIIVLESTSPVGTTKNIICPILEESNLKVGEDIYVAYSPERVLPGQILIELVNNNRIVGGINEESARIVKEIYKTFVKGNIYITNSSTAEMCKLMENTYRDVNIALANELALICEKNSINAWEVIELCNKHPRVNIHLPGPGVGGHCLAVDPWFIVDDNKEEAKIIRLAREKNDYMPYHVLDMIKKHLKDIKEKCNVSILGITYKADIDDMRESPILKLIELLKEEEKYDISVYDPYVNHEFSKNFEDTINNSDILVFGVNHKQFSSIDFSTVAKVMRNMNIIDCKNMFNKNQLKSYGFNYSLIGDGHL